MTNIALLALSTTYPRGNKGVPLFVCMLRFFWGGRQGPGVEAKRRTCDCSGRRAVSPNSLQPLWVDTENFGGCLGAERQLSRASCSTYAMICGISDAVECSPVVEEAQENPCCLRILVVRWSSSFLAALARRFRQQVWWAKIRPGRRCFCSKSCCIYICMYDKGNTYEGKYRCVIAIEEKEMEENKKST